MKPFATYTIGHGPKGIANRRRWQRVVIWMSDKLHLSCYDTQCFIVERCLAAGGTWRRLTVKGTRIG